MNIAVISGIDKETVLDSKGGTEVWTALFVSELSKRGHTIDLYAVNHSISNQNIHLIPVLEKPLPDYFTDSYFADAPETFIKRKEQFMATVFTNTLMEVKNKEHTYDLIVDSCAFPTFSFGTKFLKKPILSIGHFPVDFALDYYIKMFGLSKQAKFVFPSKFQREKAASIPSEGKFCIQHGIDISQFTFNSTGSNTMIWMSRIHQMTDKGVKEAITIANSLQRPLKVLGYIEKTSEQYVKTSIEPLITKNIDFIKVGLHTPIDKNMHLGESKIFLFPLQWEEPFGLILLEAMATGTPVVAFARGAIPEIIKDGETGFIINPSDNDIRGNYSITTTGQAGIEEAIERIFRMSDDEYKNMRRACRTHIEKNFTVEKMVDKYEQVIAA